MTAPRPDSPGSAAPVAGPGRHAPAALPTLLSILLQVLLAASPAAARPVEAPAEQAEAATAAGPADADLEVLSRSPGSGQKCIVCGGAIEGETAVEMRHRGRRFAVKESMEDELRADPQSYLSRLQAHSSLFDEEAMEGAPIDTTWLFAGVYVVVGLVFGAACSSLAMARARPPLPWFLGGLFGNVVALGALALSSSPADGGEGARPAGLGKIPSTREPRECPACGAGNHPAAAQCTRCGAHLEPQAPTETGVVRREAR